MSKSEWLDNQQGNFSDDKKDSFDPENRYVGIRLQQGVPMLDRDWNELEDIRRFEEVSLRRHYIGNGSPDDGFRISATETPSNAFRIMTGRCMVDGFEAVNAPVEGDSILYSNLTIPTEERVDTVYLDLWIEEVNGSARPELKNDQDVDMETCVRHRLMWQVRVDEGNAGYAKEAHHHYYDIAEIKRTANAPEITDTDITDLRASGRKLMEPRSPSEGLDTQARKLIDSIMKGNYPAEPAQLVGSTTHSYTHDPMYPELNNGPDSYRESFYPLKDAEGNTWIFWVIKENGTQVVRCRIMRNGVLEEPFDLVNHPAEMYEYQQPIVDSAGNLWFFYGRKVDPVPISPGSPDSQVMRDVVDEIRYVTRDADGTMSDFQLMAADGSRKRILNPVEYDDHKYIYFFWCTLSIPDPYASTITGIWSKIVGTDSPPDQLAGQTFEVSEPFRDSAGNIWLFSTIFDLTSGQNKLWRFERHVGLPPHYGHFFNIFGSINSAYEDDDGNIWVFWGDNASMLYFKVYRHGVWSRQMDINFYGWFDNDDIFKPVKHFIDDNDDAWIFWTNQDTAGTMGTGNTSRSIIHKRFDNIFASSSPEMPNEYRLTEEDIKNFDIWVDGSGRVYVIYASVSHDPVMGGGGLTNNQLKLKVNNGINWGPTIILENNVRDLINLTETDDGLWAIYRRGPYGNIWCRRFVDGDWLPPLRLASGAEYTYYLEHYQGENGDMQFLYLAADRPQGQLPYDPMAGAPTGPVTVTANISAYIKRIFSGNPQT